MTGLRIAFIATLLAGWLAPASAGEGLTPQRQREVLSQALDAFDRAVAEGPSGGAAAAALYADAARGFEALRAAGLRSAALEYNLGNTYFRLGDLGRAVLHYRRAQQLDPRDASVRANLDYARLRVEPRLRADGGRQLVQRLVEWREQVSLTARFWIAAIASGAGWLMLVAWLGWRMRPLLACGAAGVIIGGGSAALAVWELSDLHDQPPAVVVGGAPLLRQGRGEGYEPVLRAPLGPGVELRLLDERGGWVQVLLPDGLQGWIPAGSVERV